jgi:hypothetical protein
MNLILSIARVVAGVALALLGFLAFGAIVAAIMAVFPQLAG